MMDDPSAAQTVAATAPSDAPEPSTNVSTPGMSPEEQRLSIKVTLADYCAKGTAAYAQKKYVEAVDYYAQASEMQAEMNGDMDPQNADILFLYGRALFRVGVEKSDVLGGGAPDSKTASKKGGEPKTAKVKNEGPVATGETAAGSANAEDSTNTSDAPKKALFQFTGDENFAESDEDEDGDDAGDEAGEDEEPEDELANAFEILDLAKLLFMRRLEASGEDADASLIRHIKERLADTHDLLAEISLENERFPAAVADSRNSLHYKQELYPQESNLIAEAHFKLSLALEFASLTRPKDETAGDAQKGMDSEGLEAQATDETDQIDQPTRDEAAEQLEKAIESCRLQIQAKEVQIAETSNVDDNNTTKEQIKDVKEMVADMETRLKDLRAPPIDVRSALYGPQGLANAVAPGGVLGATIGESPEAAQARIDEAARNATDLTGMVKKKSKRVAVEDGNGGDAPTASAIEKLDDDSHGNGHGIGNGNGNTKSAGVKRSASEASVEEQDAKTDADGTAVKKARVEA